MALTRSVTATGKLAGNAWIFKAMDFSNPILIDLPLPIETPRLILREPRPGDGAALHGMKLETWEQIHQWMPWATEIGTEDESEANCREAYANFILRKDLRLQGFEKETGRMVIGTGLHRFDWNVRRIEIGYWVRASAQGKGYATESTNALTRYAFEVLRANAVAIDAATENRRSLSVIEKLGFEKEGIEKKSLRTGNGSLFDKYLYSRTSTDGLPDLEVRWG